MCDGVVVRVSALQSVDVRFTAHVESYQKTLENGIHSFRAYSRHIKNVVESKPESSLVVFLGKALDGMPPFLCGRQVAQMLPKWQLPSKLIFLPRGAAPAVTKQLIQLWHVSVLLCF